MIGDANRQRGGELQRLQAAGIYDPGSPTAAQREELLLYLLERFSVEEIVSWTQRSHVFGVAARAIDRPPPLLSAEEVAARADVDLDMVLDLRTAFGFPVVEPSVASIPETAVDDVRTFVLGAELYGRDEALALARVLGWAAARVMEAARATFGGTIAALDADVRTELEMSKANEIGATAWLQVQSVMVHLLAEHPLRNVGLIQALMDGELHVAVAFVDLVSSTAWMETVEPVEYSEALRRFETWASALAAERGARLIKLIGDEAMLVADDPAALCAVVDAACEMARADPVLPDARGAVGFGRVTARDGDYFGSLVNMIARATKVAAPGGFVVTAEVARALDPVRWSTEPIGPTELRGVSEKVHLSRVTRRGPEGV